MTSYALIGDSQGVGVSSSLPSLLTVAFMEPHVGWTTARIVRDGPLEHALASSADTVIIVTGGNDAPLSQAAFRELVERTHAAHKELLVVGPVFAKIPADAARHDAARAALRAAAVEAGVRFIDAYPLTRDLASTVNVHLTAARYRVYAQRLAALASPAAGGAGAGGVLAVLALAALAWWTTRA
jgi:hypothetical protein